MQCRQLYFKDEGLKAFQATALRPTDIVMASCPKWCAVASALPACLPPELPLATARSVSAARGPRCCRRL